MENIGREYQKALDKIKRDAFPFHSDIDIFESMIEQYITREHGRLGKFCGDRFIPPKS